MNLSSFLFLAALPAAFVAVLAGAPALPALAFTAPVLLLAIAANDYRSRPCTCRTPQPVRRTRTARLPLAA